jgi:UDP-N-acetylmuramoyl-L-alanyl-D-glutamate--2,6-diaminopimelate ligase
MPVLRDLIAGVPDARLLYGVDDLAIKEVRDDSRMVEPGDLFVAVPGSRADGRQFIAEALSRGAVAVVSEGGAPDGLGGARPAAWVAVRHARWALGTIAARRFGAAERLVFTGVTGTNGKTTTTYLLEAILQAAGRRPAVIGTVAYRFGEMKFPAPLTTPGALALHEILAAMQRAGATDVVMEATSIALEQGRVAGCRFRVAGLTNVTQDHLDYHGTMDRYFAAKTILFRELLTDDGISVVFADREDGLRMRAAARGRVLTVSTDSTVAADIRVRECRLDERGTRARVDTPAGEVEVDSALVGDFNLANLALAIGMAIGQGIAPTVIARGISQQQKVPGRLERVDNQAGVLCEVDYAHTPDALERALSTVRPLTRGRLIVVFGCGGDRDPTKRPVMGEAAARLSDLAIVTSDNPRTEDPARIVEMICAGVRRTALAEQPAGALAGAQRGYHVEVDRRTAIRRAISAARAGDTVVIAGKGHEDYQILGTQKVHFDDREEARSAFGMARGGPA